MGAFLINISVPHGPTSINEYFNYFLFLVIAMTSYGKKMLLASQKLTVTNNASKTENKSSIKRQLDFSNEERKEYKMSCKVFYKSKVYDWLHKNSTADCSEQKVMSRNNVKKQKCVNHVSRKKTGVYTNILPQKRKRNYRKENMQTDKLPQEYANKYGHTIQKENQKAAISRPLLQNKDLFNNLETISDHTKSYDTDNNSYSINSSNQTISLEVNNGSKNCQTLSNLSNLPFCSNTIMYDSNLHNNNISVINYKQSPTIKQYWTGHEQYFNHYDNNLVVNDWDKMLRPSCSLATTISYIHNAESVANVYNCDTTFDTNYSANNMPTRGFSSLMNYECEKANETCLFHYMPGDDYAVRVDNYGVRMNDNAVSSNLYVHTSNLNVTTDNNIQMPITSSNNKINNFMLENKAIVELETQKQYICCTEQSNDTGTSVESSKLIGFNADSSIRTQAPRANNMQPVNVARNEEQSLQFDPSLAKVTSAFTKSKVGESFAITNDNICAEQAVASLEMNQPVTKLANCFSKIEQTLKSVTDGEALDKCCLAASNTQETINLFNNNTFVPVNACAIDAQLRKHFSQIDESENNLIYNRNMELKTVLNVLSNNVSSDDNIQLCANIHSESPNTHLESDREEVTSDAFESVAVIINAQDVNNQLTNNATQINESEVVLNINNSNHNRNNRMMENIFDPCVPNTNVSLIESRQLISGTYNESQANDSFTAIFTEESILNNDTDEPSTLLLESIGTEEIFESQELNHTAVGDTVIEEASSPMQPDATESAVIPELKQPGHTTVSQINLHTSNAIGVLQEYRMQQKRKRSKVAEPTNWKVNVRKHKRNAGQTYISREGKNIKERIIKSGCGKKCRLCCHEKFDENHRKNIFNQFWALQDLALQRNFIAAHARQKPSTYTQENSRKQFTTEYVLLTKENLYERVCLRFFID